MEKELLWKSDSLVLFRDLRKDPVYRAFLRFLEIPCTQTGKKIGAFAEFCAELLNRKTDWPRYLLNLVCDCENAYTSALLTGEDTAALEPLLQRELGILEELAGYDPAGLPEPLRAYCVFPQKRKPDDFRARYAEHMRNIRKTGFGIFARFSTLKLETDGTLSGVSPRNLRPPEHLYGYETERNKVFANTKALADGKPACNVLLYGDAGTGKSSTVKSAAYRYRDDGVRLIELQKSEIALIPDLARQLDRNPLKFILFIDDVTFTQDDPDFRLLKNIMDGDSAGLPRNTVIYATSNHRHLIRESAGERDTAVNAADQVQAALTLASRFGLTVTFLRPDRETYLGIVRGLAKENALDTDCDALFEKAEAYAIRNGGRTPRTARQFIDSVLSGTERVG